MRSPFAKLSVIALLLAFYLVAGGCCGCPDRVSTRRPAIARQSQAHTSIIVIDMSGSMLTRWAALRQEITVLLDILNDRDRFNVILLHGADGGDYKLLDKSPVPADDNHKFLAQRFIRQMLPNGETRALPGLEKAIAQHPDVLYLYAEAAFDDEADVEKLLRSLPAGKPRIVAMMMFDSRRDPVVGLENLRKICQASGGMMVFRYADEN